MRAEFRSGFDNSGLPALIVATADPTEWVALQLYMRLFNSGTVKFTVECSKEPEMEVPHNVLQQNTREDALEKLLDECRNLIKAEMKPSQGVNELLQLIDLELGCGRVGR